MNNQGKLLIAILLSILAMAASRYEDIMYMKADEELVELDVADILNGEQNQYIIDSEHDTINDDNDDVCGIWLAPSTIPGAGLGMYAGKAFQKDDILASDLVIAISDLKYHNLEEYKFLWKEYTWDGEPLNMISEGKLDVIVASPGFGAAVNCIMALVNVEEYNPVLQKPYVHRSTDPGAGASTYFHHRESKAKMDIRPGKEFFVSYGNDWFKSRARLGPIPLKDDLDRATSLLKKFTNLWDFLSKRRISKDIHDDIWYTFVNNSKFTDSRIFGSFHHDDPTEINVLQTKYKNDLKALRSDESTRSLEWLEENGICADYLYAAPSTIRQANMGAFAKRSLKAGSIVAPMPMIHIADRALLNMYQINSQGLRMFNTTLSQQLLLNYCFGHSESSLLLCPYSPIVNYVNHNQTRANVRLQWSSKISTHMPELLNQTLDEWAWSDDAARLSMEIVALRDIDKDEEIFLDYGNEWEEAWNDHVANWNPTRGAEHYISAGQLVEHIGDQRLRTVFEESQHRNYPPNVEMRCDATFLKEPKEIDNNKKEGRLEEYLKDVEEDWWPCEVLKYIETSNSEFLYTANFWETKKDGTREKKKVDNLPQIAFHFVDKPVTSDTHLRNAFRHDPRIPDDIFPDKWKNKEK